MDRTTRERIDGLVKAFADEHRSGHQPDLASYLAREPASSDPDFVCELVIEDMLWRSEKGETPWVDSYLVGRVHRHRSALCRALNDWLYDASGASAAKLRVLNIGPYRTEGLIGFGGFGSVFRARLAAESSASPVAVKIAHARSRLAEGMLDNELDVLRALAQRPSEQAAGIPTVLDAGWNTSESRYLVSPLVEGVSVKQWLDSKPEFSQCEDFCRRLATLVGHLHERRIYHGDISADNVLVSGAPFAPKPHLIDFANSGRLFRAESVHPVFTIRYAAPELLAERGDGRPSSRSDVWSLAVLVYEILSRGAHPFGEFDDGTSKASWLARISGNRRPDVPGDWRARNWILESLVPDPASRLNPTPNSLAAILTEEPSRIGSQASPGAARSTASALRALKLTYLRLVKTRFGSLPIPPVDSSRERFSVPIESLVIDVPVSVEADVESRYQRDRAEPLARTHRARLAAAKPSVEDVGPFSIAVPLAKRRALALIGAPGCGKSTLFAWVAHSYASNCMAETTGVARTPAESHCPAVEPEARIPVVLLCRDIDAALDGSTLAELIDRQLARWCFPDDDRETLVRILCTEINADRAMLLIDGLDEIGEAERRRYLCGLVSDLVSSVGSKVLVTSRPIGFNAISRDLPEFVRLMVGPLTPEQRATYVRRWCELRGTDDEPLLRLHICENRRLDRVTETAFFLAILVQMCEKDRYLPNRRVDVFRDALQAMLDTQRRGTREPLGFNEIWPHLEHLAFRIRQEPRQHLPDREVVEEFLAARRAEPSGPDLVRRGAGELLDDLLDRLHILNVAGVDYDALRGTQLRSIQFFHQLIQEYFAARAIVFGRGGDSAGPVDRILRLVAPPRKLAPGWRGRVRDWCIDPIARLLRTIPAVRRLVRDPRIGPARLSEWSIAGLARGQRTEPVVAEHWQETIAMAIAQMPARTGDTAILAILGGERLPPRERRARVLLALRCLADDPPVNQSTADASFAALGDCLAAEDGLTDGPNTLMDSAIGDLAIGRWGPRLLEHLGHAATRARGESQWRLFLAYLTANRRLLPDLSSVDAASVLIAHASHIRASSGSDRIGWLLGLLNFCYATRVQRHSTTSRLQEHAVRDAVVASLLDAMTSPEPTARAIAPWALSWFLGAPDPKQAHQVRLTQTEMQVVSEVLRSDGACPGAQAHAALILSMRSDRPPTFAEAPYESGEWEGDWIYATARVADGAEPQRWLRRPVATDGDWRTDVLGAALASASAVKVRSAAAIALGRLGHFPPSGHDALVHRIEDVLLTDEERDEALTYLALSRTTRAASYLAALIHRASGDDNFLQQRGVLGLVLHGAPETLACVLSDPRTPPEDVSAAAFALAGIEDERGRNLLYAMNEHADPRVATAVNVALTKVRHPDAAWRPGSGGRDSAVEAARSAEA